MTGPVSVHQGLRWGGGVAIVAIAVTRCVITFAPRVVFDVDPSIDATPLAGLGPAGSLVLDALLLAACGAALLGETLSKRGLDWWLLAAALLPVPAVIGHALMDSEDLWRGGTWMAAATACAVVAHLGRQRFMRIVLLALLAAVLAPVAVRGMTQVSISWAGVEWVGPEHGQTLAQFEANRDVFFADRGWAPDSAAAMIYERRLRQADPRGWFPTANLFASMMAFGTVLLAGLTIGAVRQRVGRGWPAALAPGALVIAGALLLAGSKGAIGAAGIGLALLAAPLAGDRARTFLARYGGVTTIGLVAAALLAVVVRGAVLPESWLGEQSLLFRWHYLVGAARVFADQGLMGVGPDGFQAAYAAHRLPTSPEEITSAHNMFADWLTTLGILGIGWVVLVLLLTWRAGVRVDSDSGEDADTSSGQARRWGRIALLTSAAVAVFGLMPALAFEAASFSGVGTEIARGAGIVGFVAAASVLVMVMVRLSAAVVTWTLTAAAVALVVHGQIEMTLFDPGCVTWAMCLVGLAGGASVREGAGRAGAVTSAIILLVMLWLVFGCMVPMLRASALMIEAAGMLAGRADSRVQEVQRRRRAAETLLAASRIAPAYDVPLEEAARQFMIAASLADDDARAELIDRAVTAAEDARQAFDEPETAALVSEARWIRYSMFHRADDRVAAIESARTLTVLDPNGIMSWRRLGDILWEAGRREEAVEAYRRALQADANFHLDPLKQLSQRERERISGRVMGEE